MQTTKCMIAVGAIVLGLLGGGALAQSKPAGGFDSLKALAGTWQAPSPEKEGGGVTTNTIRLVSNGSSIEETVQSKEDNQMVTLYSPDGDRISLTHYCSMGNQPRMETSATKSGQTTFDFGFIGATNLKSPADMHMHKMIFHIIDKDHFDETWTLMQDGKPQEFTFHFTRKS
jgi:hypothetical protein